MKRNNQVRIIGGKWRGRKLTFPEVVGLRPTHARVRETLFNWLAPYIMNSVCLDLFAGSGALGYEALSRGAKKVVFVDKNKKVISSLKENKVRLDAEAAIIIAGSFLQDNFCHEESFDIVFLDPPFQHDMLAPACSWLIQKGFVHTGTFVYFEHSLDASEFIIPERWALVKSKQTSTLQYALVEVR